MAREKYITKTYQVYEVEVKGLEGKKQFVGKTADEVREACETLGLEIESMEYSEQRYGITESTFLANAKKM